MVAMVLTATASLSLLGVSSIMTASMQSIAESTTSTWKLLSIFGGKMGDGSERVPSIPNKPSKRLRVLTKSIPWKAIIGAQ